MRPFRPQYLLSPAIISKIEAISRMEGELRRLLQAGKESVFPFSIARAEAVHFSTRLEGNLLTLKQVTQALSGKAGTVSGEKNLREVINYSRAGHFLAQQVGSSAMVNLPLILKVHAFLMSGLAAGGLKGRLRKAQNIIQDGKTGGIVYIPPDFSELKALMNALILWLERARAEDISPLIMAPIFHWRFVTLHPFMDGNGRAARLLTNHILQCGGYGVHKAAAIEKQHETDKGMYYASLRKCQADNFYDIPENADLTPWLAYWMRCLEKTYEEALSRAAPKAEATLFEPEPDRRVRMGAEMFQRFGKMSASNYQALTGLGRTQAVKDLNSLIKQKVIRRLSGGRSSIYEIRPNC